MQFNEYERNLLQYVHPFYAELLESYEILTAGTKEVGRLNEKIADLSRQFRISTATWGLSEWERIVGTSSYILRLRWDDIEAREVDFDFLEGTVWNDINKKFSYSVPDRREAIKVKIQGFESVTKQNLINMVAKFGNGTIEIEEDNPNYFLSVRFVDENGIPPNVEELKELIRMLIPAHITIEFFVQIMIWSDVADYTWGALKVTAWENVKGGMFDG